MHLNVHNYLPPIFRFQEILNEEMDGKVYVNQNNSNTVYFILIRCQFLLCFLYELLLRTVISVLTIVTKIIH